MNVSLNTVNYYSRTSFNAKRQTEKNVVTEPITYEQRLEAKTSRTISELFCTVLAVSSLYLYAKVKWFK